MYKEQNIREILEEKIKDKENFSITNVMQIIENFVEKFGNDEAFRCVFCIDEFDDACVKKRIWNISPTEYYADTVEVGESFSVLKSLLQSDVLSDAEKRELAYAFVESFIQNSDDECGCEHRVYIIIENMSDGKDYVEKYDDYDVATAHAQETYESMLDDEILAENIWFPIMSQLQNYEYDELKNYSTIIKMDASGLDELRNSYDDEDGDE